MNDWVKIKSSTIQNIIHIRLSLQKKINDWVNWMKVNNELVNKIVKEWKIMKHKQWECMNGSCNKKM